MKVLFIGDIVGNPARKMLKEFLPGLRQEKQIDFVVANGENAAGGSGITYIVAQELYNCGIDAITLGNHTWSKREVFSFIDSDNKIIRPANYSPGVPGKGSVIIGSRDIKIGLVNLIGRVYMDPAECPFIAAVREIEYMRSSVRVVIVDFHAEATSEKCALAWYLDGRVSAVIGTHTHVQTSDEKILPCGTGFITDVGMTGPYESIIGVNKDIIINKFVTQLPAKFEVAHGSVQFNAVLLDIDERSGKTVKIERLFTLRD